MISSVVFKTATFLSLIGLVMQTRGLVLGSSSNRIHTASPPDSKTHNSQPTQQNWYKVNSAPDDLVKTLIFAVKNRDPQAIDERLRRISDPDSSEYGQYLSFEEVGALTRNEEATSAVRLWLTNAGVDEEQMHETRNGEFFRVHVPVKVANSLLNAEFTVFENLSKPGVQMIRATELTVPAHLESHLDFVGEALYFPPEREALSMMQRVQSEDKGEPVTTNIVTPQLLRDFYSISEDSVNPKSTQAVFEALGQHYSPRDLSTFQRLFKLTQKDVDEVMGENSGPSCHGDKVNCREANLDIQYISALAGQSPTTLWSLQNSTDLYLDWVMQLADDPNPPLVHSISYGSYERIQQNAQRFNEEIMKLGLRGISVVVASGDDGANGFMVRKGNQHCGVNAFYPGSSPFVVTVGATQGPEANLAEVACSADNGGLITTGGGFSRKFERPWYQHGAVASFFSKTSPTDLPDPQIFNREGRAYPDVALLGKNYYLINGGEKQILSGTSASAPVFAAMLTRINGKLLSNGLPVVGFINPLLYKLAQNPGVFNDITSGSNHCGAGYMPNVICCPHAGFTSVEGFDPVTGLGSVNYAALEERIMEFHATRHQRNSQLHVAFDAMEHSRRRRLRKKTKTRIASLGT